MPKRQERRKAMSKKRPSISKKLSRTIMWLAIPIFLVSQGIFYDHAHKMIQKEAVNRSSTILDNAVLRIESFISLIETAAKSNLWMLEENFTPDSLQAISRRIVSLNHDVLSCTVSTEPNTFPEIGRYFSVYTVDEGDTVITTVEPEFEYFDRVWYRQAIHMGKPCWVEPFSDFSAGTINYHDAIASYCIPIRPKGGQVTGVVSVDFSFRQLAKEVTDTDHPYPSSYYVLIGEDGRFLIHPNTNLLFKKTIFMNTDVSETPDIIALGHEMTGGKTGTTHIHLNDKLWHVCYAPIPRTKWSLALISPEDEVLEEYHHFSIVMFIIVIIGLVLIRWLTGKVVRKNIQPINQLLDATKKIANGDYSEIIPSTTRKDIVSMLQNAFREMQLAIISHTKAIKETTCEIEQENAKLEEILPLAKEAAKRRQAFIHTVSTKISKPLNVINGLANVLQDNLQKSKTARKQQEEEINDITNTIRHNTTLLYGKMLMLSDSSETALSNASRYDKNDWVLCNEMTKNCIRAAEQRYPGREMSFVTEVPDTLKIKTNKLYLKRTLCELIYNAAKFSDGQHISLQVKQTDTHVLFIIEDKGPGLPKDTYDMLFVPFTKVDESSDGLGLGLPLCKGHTVNLGGQLIYDESYHDGCRFILEMPKP